MPLLFLLLMSSSSLAHALCDGVEVRGEIRPSLTEVERRLVCGDATGPAPWNDVWADVPANQARFHLRAFLSDRGYQHPEFTRVGEGLRVNPGSPSRVDRIEIAGGPPGFSLDAKRGFIGELLRPSLLDELEASSRHELQSLGYACAEVKVEAIAPAGEPAVVRLAATPGERRVFGETIEDPLSVLRPGTLRRYDAHEVGAPFHPDRLRLKERRVADEGVLQSLHVGVENCTPGATGAVTLRETATPGLPRLLAFGFGANTEEGPIGRASWKNTRLGRGASLLEFGASASFRRQRMRAALQGYPLARPSRFHLRPQLEVDRRSEVRYESVAARAQLHPATTFDVGGKLGGLLEAGPTLEATRTIRGADPGASRLVTLDASFEARSHEFEFHRDDPREGWESRIDLRVSDEAIHSTISARQLRWAGHALWNFREQDPPWLVLGARWSLATTALDAPSGGRVILPPTFRYFLGGSSSLRGFGRDELPDNATGEGALTALSTGFEARGGQLVVRELQPLAFLDVGALGDATFSLTSRLHLSPGVGLRWRSPIGALRGTVGHGWSGEAGRLEPRHVQFFVSLGEEF